MRIVSSLKSNILLASLIGAFLVNPCTVLAETSTGQANDLFATNVENRVVNNRGHKIVPYGAIQYEKVVVERYKTFEEIPSTKRYREYNNAFMSYFSGTLYVHHTDWDGSYHVVYYKGMLMGSGL